MDFVLLKKTSNINYLVGQVKNLNGTLMSGISGIIGETNKPFRISSADYVARLTNVLNLNLDCILLYQSPGNELYALDGNEAIFNTIKHDKPNLIVAGHSHWQNPSNNFPYGSQVLNVDKRVVILINHALL